MAYRNRKLEELAGLVAQHGPQEGVNLTSVESVGTFKASTTLGRSPAVDQAGLVIVVQGRKYCYVGDKTYDYSAGKALIMFFPMAVEIEIFQASPEEPFLAAGVLMDLGRMADMMLRIDRIDGAPARPVSIDPSGVFSTPLNDDLLDPTIRLFKALDKPRDAAILGEPIVDEIYYRILCGERGDDLRNLLQQRGQIQRISRAVEYIHRNLDKPVSVDGLADMVHMSKTTFHDHFRDVMHISPLQYAKAVKLHKAQALIQEGKKANEAGYLVGYNSPAQFSREYKRHFGFSPSAT